MPNISWKHHCTMLIVWISTMDVCQPIMVKFGTSNEPIPVSASSRSNSFQARNIVPRSPAPVTEYQEDIPNPNRYQPYVPHKLKTKFYSISPSPNSIVETRINPSHKPELLEYNTYRKQYSRTLGPEYTGPHIFEKQAYEFLIPQKIYLRRYFPNNDEEKLGPDQTQKLVPQLGIVPSASGVRYYVPKPYYFPTNDVSAADENSVYDKTDEKYSMYNSAGR